MYQSDIYKKFEKYRLQRTDPNYPPHHEGQHLEESFCQSFKQEKSQRIFIPVHWTAVYNYKILEGLHKGSPNDSLRKELQEDLYNLDQNKEYFVVCTHDDAPKEILPKNTIVFAAGGNASKIDYAIPLICSPHKNIYDHPKEIFCSFVGSMTHDIRNKSLAPLVDIPSYVIQAFHWAANVPSNQVDLFRRVTERSRFCLCPRGYGATSYRLYEAMQLGSIPVYISDNHLLPWGDIIDWSKFCVVINLNNLDNIDKILKSYTETQIQEMYQNLQKMHDKHFTIEKTISHIIKRVQE